MKYNCATNWPSTLAIRPNKKRCKCKEVTKNRKYNHFLFVVYHNQFVVYQLIKSSMSCNYRSLFHKLKTLEFEIGYMYIYIYIYLIFVYMCIYITSFFQITLIGIRSGPNCLKILFKLSRLKFSLLRWCMRM